MHESVRPALPARPHSSPKRSAPPRSWLPPLRRQRALPQSRPPELPIYAVVPDETAAGAVVLSWGVIPVIVPKIKDLGKLISAMRKKVTSSKLVKRGGKYILVAGKWREKRGVHN